MTNEEILKKALDKAEKNGFRGSFGLASAGNACEAHSIESDGICVFSTIFSHNFAKAFWGEEHQIVKVQRQQIYCQKCGQQVLEGAPMVGEWQYHLQQMVLEENPISYLERFLE